MSTPDDPPTVTPAHTPAVTSCDIDLRPDGSRMIARLFVAGREEVGAGGSRAAPVVERVLALPESELAMHAQDAVARLGSRHRDPVDLLRRHARVAHSRLDDGAEPLTEARELVLGACFTHEYAIEGAALCNPSIVPHPVQPDDGGLAFVLSVRGIGEGHRSSIGFRTGAVASDGTVTLDDPGPYAVLGEHEPGVNHRRPFELAMDGAGDTGENASFVLDALGPTFDDGELDAQLRSLVDDGATRSDAGATVANLRALARRSYRVRFDAGTALAERVLWPQVPVEQHGMEDARFVRFVDDDGEVTYLATYTGYDGTDISQQLLATQDFVTFDASPLVGAAASNKGLAIFPRRVGGRYVALSRSDRETNAVAFSDDLRCWPTSQVIQTPERPWELLQLGNCGSPLETDAGWLVLTHAVGPLRTYTIGAMLLDLDDPTVVLGRTVEPLIRPGDAGRDGYVPNVVYTCGALLHGELLVVPYGVADQHIAVVTVDVRALLRSMRAG